MKRTKLAMASLFMVFVMPSTGFCQADEMQDNINLVKQNLTESREKIKKYEWIETITTYINGEQKSVKQNQCYYGVDGTLTKVATGGTTAPAKTPGGIRGKIAENKKEEMGDYMELAVQKIRSYMPPQPEKLQKVYSAGKTGIKIVEPGKKFKLDFPDYNTPGDVLSITLDKEHKLLTGYSVNTFVEGANDPVSMDITFKTLPDGTTYPGEATFNSASKKIKIVMTNSGFKAGAGQ
jgi:hypothetical protein